MEKWTEDDLIYLEYFAYEGDTKIKEAANFLGRTTGATYAMLGKLRKENENIECLRKKWTEKEDEILKKNHKTLTHNQIAILLSRTEGSVKYRCLVLGLKKQKNINEYKDEILKLVKEGHYESEIARKLKIHRNSLANFLKRNNIKCTVATNEQMTREIRKREEIGCFARCLKSKYRQKERIEK